MQNHHLTSISTPPQFFARQFFLAVGPISGKLLINHLLCNTNALWSMRVRPIETLCMHVRLQNALLRSVQFYALCSCSHKGCTSVLTRDWEYNTGKTHSPRLHSWAIWTQCAYKYLTVCAIYVYAKSILCLHTRHRVNPSSIPANWKAFATLRTTSSSHTLLGRRRLRTQHLLCSAL